MSQPFIGGGAAPRPLASSGLHASEQHRGFQPSVVYNPHLAAHQQVVYRPLHPSEAASTASAVVGAPNPAAREGTVDSFRACAWCLLITTMILSLIGLLLLLAGAFGSPSPASQSSKTPADQQDDLDAVRTVGIVFLCLFLPSSFILGYRVCRRDGRRCVLSETCNESCNTTLYVLVGIIVVAGTVALLVGAFAEPTTSRSSVYDNEADVKAEENQLRGARDSGAVLLGVGILLYALVRFLQRGSSSSDSSSDEEGEAVEGAEGAPSTSIPLHHSYAPPTAVGEPPYYAIQP